MRPAQLFVVGGKWVVIFAFVLVCGWAIGRLIQKARGRA
jgi:flagellar biogenesis protein FliO